VTQQDTAGVLSGGGRNSRQQVVYAGSTSKVEPHEVQTRGGGVHMRIDKGRGDPCPIELMDDVNAVSVLVSRAI